MVLFIRHIHESCFDLCDRWNNASQILSVGKEFDNGRKALEFYKERDDENYRRMMIKPLRKNPPNEYGQRKEGGRLIYYSKLTVCFHDR